MNADTRKRLLVVVLLAVMGALWYRALRNPAAPPPGAAGPAAVSRADGAPASREPVIIDLASLDAEPPAPTPAGRNLFRFGRSEPVRAAAPVFVVPAPAPVQPIRTAPAAPALPLRLIGIVQPRASSPRVAVLSDERGVYHGSEGSIIEGQYRILRVDAESVEIAGLDGANRHVLRLPGS